MGTDKKITPAGSKPVPTPPAEQGNPFKAYSTPAAGQGSSSDADADKD